MIYLLVDKKSKKVKHISIIPVPDDLWIDCFHIITINKPEIYIIDDMNFSGTVIKDDEITKLVQETEKNKLIPSLEERVSIVENEIKILKK